MAEVYKAEQPSLERLVAIKLLHPFLADDTEFKERFEREARNVARLKHPNIVQVYDFEFDLESESYYMVMELIDGQTLKDHLESLGSERMPISAVLRIIKSALEALAYAHGRGMIHRDIKPANLMLENDGRVVLTDFGIAKIVTGNQFTASGGMVGTPAYMSPEQGLGETADERCDVYSMGVILYQMVTGKLPYDGETPLATVLKHLNDPIPSARTVNPEVPDAVERIIRKAMAKQPEERYQTAQEMLDDVNAVAGGGKPSVADTPIPKGNRAGAKTASQEIGRLSSETLIMTGEALRQATTPPSGRRAGRTGMVGMGLVGLLIGGVVFVSLQTGRIPLLNIPLFAASVTTTATATSATVENVVPTATDLPFVPPSATPTETDLPTATFTATVTATDTATSTSTATSTATFTATHTPTATNTATFTTTPTATFTATFTTTPTATATWTLTPTASNTPTATHTHTATITLTPSDSPTPTANITATLQIATETALAQTRSAVETAVATLRVGTTPTPDFTKTAQACRFQFSLVSPLGEPNPNVSGDVRVKRVNSDVEYEIVIRNDSDCDWGAGVFLKFLEGERFASPLRIEAQESQTVRPGEELRFTFKGKAIKENGRPRGLASGVWEVRLSDGKLLGTIDIMVFVFG
jgi:serine/threonine-protein kinase